MCGVSVFFFIITAIKKLDIPCFSEYPRYRTWGMPTPRTRHEFSGYGKDSRKFRFAICRVRWQILETEGRGRHTLGLFQVPHFNQYPKHDHLKDIASPRVLENGATYNISVQLIIPLEL
jgi:hypothetical protein